MDKSKEIGASLLLGELNYANLQLFLGSASSVTAQEVANFGRSVCDSSAESNSTF